MRKFTNEITNEHKKYSVINGFKHLKAGSSPTTGTTL